MNNANPPRRARGAQRALKNRTKTEEGVTGSIFLASPNEFAVEISANRDIRSGIACELNMVRLQEIAAHDRKFQIASYAPGKAHVTRGIGGDGLGRQRAYITKHQVKVDSCGQIKGGLGHHLILRARTHDSRCRTDIHRSWPSL